MTNKIDCYATCKLCKRFKTMECPNSGECLDKENKPYFVPIEAQRTRKDDEK